MTARHYWLLVYFTLVGLLASWFFFSGEWLNLSNFGRLTALAGLVLALLGPRCPRPSKNVSAVLSSGLVAEHQKLRGQLEEFKHQLVERDRALRSKDVELKLINQRFQKLDRAKFQFVSVATHQLRTPLAAIKWTFHMLLTGSLGSVTEEQKEFLHKGFDGTERAITIVNELLNIDYVESHQTDYQFGDVDLLELAANVAAGFQDQAREHKLQLTVMKPATPPPVVEADPRKLSIVLENLVDNAIKYTSEGGQITVTIDDSKLNSARSVLTVVVADSGIGIPLEDRERMFQRFFRCSNAVKKVPDGNGLGLAIAKEIVDHHQGEIRFADRDGGGTSFFVTIPVRQNKI